MRSNTFSIIKKSKFSTNILSSIQSSSTSSLHRTYYKQNNINPLKKNNNEYLALSVQLRNKKRLISKEDKEIEKEDPMDDYFGMDVAKTNYDLSIQDVSKELIEDVFSEESLKVSRLSSMVYEYAKKNEDTFPRKDPINIIPTDEGDVEAFREQFGDEQLLDEIVASQTGAGLDNLENKPEISSKPSQAFYDKQNEDFFLFLKRNQHDVDLFRNNYHYYQYLPDLFDKVLGKNSEDNTIEGVYTVPDQLNERIPVNPHNKIENVDLSKMDELEESDFQNEQDEQEMSKVDVYMKAKDYVSKGMVDEPNKSYLHIFSDKVPLDITKEDIMKMYIINSQDYAKYFKNCLSKELESVFQDLYQRSLMVRPPVLPVIDHIKRVNNSLKSNEPISEEDNKRGFILTGLKGGGKSSLLTIATHYAYKNNCLVFHIPDGYHWTNGHHYVEPSPLLKGYFDCPDVELEFLRKFQRANSEILKKINISGQYDFPVEQGQSVPKTLHDLINYGMIMQTNQSIAFKILLDEIKNIEDIPVVLCIDDYNFLTDETGFFFGDFKDLPYKMPDRVHGNKYVLTRFINQVILQNKPNHIVICAESHKHKTRSEHKLQDNVLNVIQVPRYEYNEIRTICDYYTSTYWIFSEPNQYLGELIYLSGGVAGDVWNELKYL